MSIIRQPFEIAYCGVTITIFPVIDGSDMKYLVQLPTRFVTIETVFDEDEIDFWQEVPAGRTEIAQAIGSIIEEKYM